MVIRHLGRAGSQPEAIALRGDAGSARIGFAGSAKAVV
jgi:hypothetical protein